MRFVTDPFNFAVLHHEFEHTRYGSKPGKKSAEEEVQAVIQFENPVWVLNGFEPRYTYTDTDTSGSTANFTLSIIKAKEGTIDKKSGAWTFDKNDPRILVK